MAARAITEKWLALSLLARRFYHYKVRIHIKRDSIVILIVMKNSLMMWLCNGAKHTYLSKGDHQTCQKQYGFLYHAHIMFLPCKKINKTYEKSQNWKLIKLELANK